MGLLRGTTDALSRPLVRFAEARAHHTTRAHRVIRMNVAPVPSSPEESNFQPTPIARTSHVALWAICRRHEWISVDPCSTETCVEACESRCTPLQWHPQSRSFSTHFKDSSRAQHFIKRVVCQ